MYEQVHVHVYTAKFKLSMYMYILYMYMHVTMMLSNTAAISFLIDLVLISVFKSFTNSVLQNRC